MKGVIFFYFTIKMGLIKIYIYVSSEFRMYEYIKFNPYF